MVARDYNGKRIYYIGIKGTGMIGCATLAYEAGAHVTGSDTNEVFVTDHILLDQGIGVTDFSPEHISSDIDLVVYSIAYPETHPQRVRAVELGIPCMSYTEHAAEFFNDREGLVVIGSHGKTTTSAMLAHTLMALGDDPTALIGGEVVEWEKTARFGKGAYMVMEGDEYGAKFLALHPRAVICTNIDYDHPDYFKTPEAYTALFQDYLEQLPEKTLLVLSDEAIRTLGTSFMPKGQVLVYSREAMRLRALGEHNEANASGVLALLIALGYDREKILAGLESFRGTKRRLEQYSRDGASLVVYDDFAHHPSEIKATLSALTHAYPATPITAIFQPHTYSRTEALLLDFATAFGDAEDVYILDMYTSVREKSGNVGSHELAEAIAKKHAHVEEASDREGLITAITQKNTPRVVVCLGAGNGWEVARDIMRHDAGVMSHE